MSTELELLAIGESARLLGVSTDTVRRLGRRGILPEYRDYRGARHYRRDDVERVRGDRRPKLQTRCPGIGGEAR